MKTSENYIMFNYFTLVLILIWAIWILHDLNNVFITRCILNIYIFRSFFNLKKNHFNLHFIFDFQNFE